MIGVQPVRILTRPAFAEEKRLRLGLGREVIAVSINERTATTAAALLLALLLACLLLCFRLLLAFLGAGVGLNVLIESEVRKKREHNGGAASAERCERHVRGFSLRGKVVFRPLLLQVVKYGTIWTDSARLYCGPSGHRPMMTTSVLG
jgi:hypothetical protein